MFLNTTKINCETRVKESMPVQRVNRGSSARARRAAQLGSLVRPRVSSLDRARFNSNLLVRNLARRGLPSDVIFRILRSAGHRITMYGINRALYPVNY